VIETLSDFIGIFVLVYSGLFSLTLLIFAAYQYRLILLNVTSNERLRGKWNSEVDQGVIELSAWEKLWYFMVTKPESQSRVEMWAAID
jgi:hypothetical protein